MGHIHDRYEYIFYVNVILHFTADRRLDEDCNYLNDPSYTVRNGKQQ